MICKPLNIIYDISVLGMAFVYPLARTGVFRTCEELAYQLASVHLDQPGQSGQSLRLIFCASQENEQDAAAYLRQNPKLNHIELDVPGDRAYLNQVLIRWIARLNNKINGQDPAFRLFYRAMRKGLTQVKKNCFSDCRVVSPAKLAAAHVYHSMYYKIPQQIREDQKIKKILTIHDIIPILYPQFFQNNKRHYIHEVINSITGDDFVMTVSESSKNDLCRFKKDLKPENVFVTYPAASELFYVCQDMSLLKQVRIKYGIAPDQQYILSVSTLEPRKNLVTTIRSYINLIRESKINDLKLVLVGSQGWDMEDPFKEIKDFEQFKNNIIFTGFVDDLDLAPLYSQALAFIFPSFYEGFGLPPLEAMKCGTPVITSNQGSLPEVVGRAGYLVDALDHDSISHYMSELYKNSKLREKMSQAALNQACQFSWQKCKQKVLELYQAVV